MRNALKYSLMALSALLFTGCVLVDQDMSDCETDYTLDYELRLVTNMTTELQTQLSMAADVNVSSALQKYMSGIFTDYAHDVNLSFYDVYGDSTRLHNERHIMDANQSSYTLFIPVRKYMHIAIANIEDNHEVGLEKDEICHTSRLFQPIRDTVESHSTGVFTARLPMDIKEGEDQQFDVKLYMANCATALVLDTLGSHIKDIDVYATGFATGFVNASLLFCVGAMAVVGALEAGLQNKPDTLLAKSALDGVFSVILASSFGPGVIFSAVPILIYQGGIALLSGVLSPLLTDALINEMSAVGSLLIIGIGLNSMGFLKDRIRVGNMLPAIIIPCIYLPLVGIFG